MQAYKDPLLDLIQLNIKQAWGQKIFLNLQAMDIMEETKMKKKKNINDS